MKEYRIIWTLSDGRKKYSIKRGEPELWNEQAIKFLSDHFKPNLMAYSNDLSLFFANASFLRGSDSIGVVSYEIEDSTKPVRKDVILY